MVVVDASVGEVGPSVGVLGSSVGVVLALVGTLAEAEILNIYYQYLLFNEARTFLLRNKPYAVSSHQSFSKLEPFC